MNSLGWLLGATVAMGIAAQVWAGDLGATIYAETSGLRPVPAEIEGGGEAREGQAAHDPQSLAQLQAARRWIGEVTLSRGFKGVAPPAKLSKRDRDSREAMAIWRMCREAATQAGEPGGDHLEGKRVTHFLLRKGGTPEQGGKPRRPDWARGRLPVLSLGPFRCVGGGDVPAGDNVWIDFFAGIPF